MELQSTTKIVGDYGQHSQDGYEAGFKALQALDMFKKHAFMLEQKPEIWMFIQCLPDGTPFSEFQIDCLKTGMLEEFPELRQQWNEATERLWFKDFDYKPEYSCVFFPSYCKTKSGTILFFNTSHPEFRIHNDFKTIEDFVKYGLILTPQKQKEVYGSI